MKIINPATEELIREVAEDDSISVGRKFRLLKEGQRAWESVSLQDRIRILQRFSELLGEQIESLAATLTSEVGKPIQQSRNEINGARTRIKWLTDNAEKYLADERMTDADGMEETISYEPLGVVCNISAWNYPYLVGVNVFVPALLAGNALMYKPSEYATLTGLEIGRLLNAAGVNEDVFQVAIGGAITGGHLLDLPFDGYFFTGSYNTGKLIYEKVAQKMVPCQCELGGKDPLYIADDIGDATTVAAGTADGAFYNNGQSCCAVERIYVNEKVYEEYVNAFVMEVKSWKSGPPTEDGIYIGPLTRKDQLAILEEQVADAIAKGAKLMTGGRRAAGRGYYFEPTVLTDVTQEMKLMRDESFGPIIGIMKVSSDEQAIRMMKDTDYGLTAAVYSSSKERAKKILKEINAGTGYWNCCDRVSASMPWSGRNHSGFGVTLSHAGLRAFAKPKSYQLRSN